VNNFQPRLNHDPCSNSYNVSCKQHPNFSYRIEPLSFPQANVTPTLRGFQRPSFPPQAPPPQKSNLESMLESVLLAQQEQDEHIKQLTFKVDLLITHNKMLETQIGQQANYLLHLLVDYQVSLNRTQVNNAMPLC